MSDQIKNLPDFEQVEREVSRKIKNFMDITSNKKLQEKIMTSTIQKQELQNKIWKIANDVRGAVDGWDFKQFV